MYIYGSDQPEIQNLINEDSSLGEKLHPRLDFLKAEVVFAARHELARTVDDVLARRVRMLFMDAKAAIESAPEVAALLAKELEKDEAWKEKQVADFKEIAKHYTI